MAGEQADPGIGLDRAASLDLRVIDIWNEALGAVMAPDRPLALRPSLRIPDCVGYPLILADKSTATRPHIDLALAGN